MLPISIAFAGGPFPDLIQALEGAPPEGFAIGRGTNAYNGSIDGSIYKMNLRNGRGEVLVEAEPGFNLETDCYKLGMRVDQRRNYLFVAGCQVGNAYVFDAKSGEEIMQYQLTPEFAGVVNDLTITRDAVYFTDSFQPVLYRLPLGRRGSVPEGADAATTIPLPDEFINTDPFCCAGNGIVSTPNGKTLIVGHSNLAKLYRVDTDSGEVNEIVVDPPLSGFLDGIVMHHNILFIITPTFGPPDPEKIQVVALDEDMLTGELLGYMTDPTFDGVASGGIHGNSLYVNNARYATFPEADTEYWITKLSIYNLE
jgi:sugar lactone lactonase YvrE